METTLQTAKDKLEEVQIDNETIQTELEIMQEEKEMMELEKKEQEDERLKAYQENMSEDEMRDQNEKLRIALRKLYGDIEIERNSWEEKMTELSDKVKIIPELEEKLKDVDVLLDAVEERD